MIIESKGNLIAEKHGPIKITIEFPKGWFNNEDEINDEMMKPIQYITDLVVDYMTVATSNKEAAVGLLINFRIFLESMIKAHIYQHESETIRISVE